MVQLYDSNLYSLHGSRTTGSTHHKRDGIIYNESLESKYHQKVKEIQNKDKFDTK